VQEGIQDMHGEKMRDMRGMHGLSALRGEGRREEECGGGLVLEERGLPGRRDALRGAGLGAGYALGALGGLKREKTMQCMHGRIEEKRRRRHAWFSACREGREEEMGTVRCWGVEGLKSGGGAWTHGGGAPGGAGEGRREPCRVCMGET